MTATFDAAIFLFLIWGLAPPGRVTARDGRIVLEDASGQMTSLTQTGLDSDPWLSFDAKTVVFLRHSPDDQFRTSAYEIDLPTRSLKLLFAGLARYQGREISYFGRPQLDESRRTLFLLTHEYATEGSLISIHLESGQARLISEHVAGYDIVACPSYRGDLIALKRQLDIFDHPFFLYWLYSPEGAELRLAGGGELDIDMETLRDGNCPVPQPLPLAPPPHDDL